MSKTSKRHNYTLKTSSLHREEETQNTNSHMTIKVRPTASSSFLFEMFVVVVSF